MIIRLLHVSVLLFIRFQDRETVILNNLQQALHLLSHGISKKVSRFFIYRDKNRDT